MRQRWLSYLLVFASFYEQLAWAPVLVLLAAGVGDAEAVALAASAYSLANLGGNLLFGVVSDRVGRHRVAGAGLVAMAATALLHLAAATPLQLVGARFLHGLTAAAVAPSAFASVTDGAPGARRGEVMARVGLVIALASMAAPALTGRLAKGMGVPVAVELLGLGLALVGFLTLAVGKGSPRMAVAVHTDGDTRVNPVLILVGAAVAFAVMFGQNVLFYALPLRGTEMGMSTARVGGLLSTFAVGALIAFVPPLGRSADRWGRVPPILAGMGLTSLGLFLLAAAADARGMAVGLTIYGLGFGLAFPAVSALSGDAAGAGRRGLAFGVLTAAFSAGAIVGPLVTRMLEGLLPPFVVAGLVALVGAGAALGALRQPKAVAPPVGPGA